MLERYGHGGDLITAEETYGLAKEQFIDFSSNMNPLGSPDCVETILTNTWKELVHYPDPAVRKLRHAIAECYQIPMDSILVGNGAAELIDLTVRFLQPEMTALARPCFSEYDEAVSKIQGKTLDIYLKEENQFELQTSDIVKAADQCDLFFLGHPNNPTGKLISQPVLHSLLDTNQPVVLDEAFIDFVPFEKQVSLMNQAYQSNNLFVIRSMTKFFAIPGIRLGFMIAHPNWIRKIQSLQVQWSVNALAQSIGASVLHDHAYIKRTKNWLVQERSWFESQLSDLGLKVYSSDTNYLLVQLPPSIHVKKLQEQLAHRGILIRDASLFKGLNTSFFRIAIRLREQNEMFISKIKQVFI
ncbi:threonine-phosphate decarboxylase CobD [Chengkuizengella axinellae]|uniref:threonine-phosphate decarboxylase n=1 Tax=Chengkuizengella axinellae TaxID=3064388 RepID=A0ABT9J0Q9_9BACL|nr:threonine-phosphate decarboxylase CobD [Chengkuizengella sp. 2205SS18-9]MDP5275209.1 threonine-phosphate decarboxylase CobD [Chengkuizengella sp. 2205SS18-9]